MEMKVWTQQEATELCKKIEAICPQFGCHVALTGGCLYGGSMKDCDILFYRIRQVDEVDQGGLWAALRPIGVVKESGYGWCFKLNFYEDPQHWCEPKKIDAFFPEEQGGPEYGSEDEIVRPDEVAPPL